MPSAWLRSLEQVRLAGRREGPFAELGDFSTRLPMRFVLLDAEPGDDGVDERGAVSDADRGRAEAV